MKELLRYIFWVTIGLFIAYGGFRLVVHEPFVFDDFFTRWWFMTCGLAGGWWFWGREK